MPLLNMVELTIAFISPDVRSVALIAARPTVESGIFQSHLRSRNIKLVEVNCQTEVDHLIGATRDATDPVVFTRLWEGLINQAHAQGADAIIVACLDLSGVMVHARTSVQVIEAARCLAQATIAQWLNRRDAAHLHEREK